MITTRHKYIKAPTYCLIKKGTLRTPRTPEDHKVSILNIICGSLCHLRELCVILPLGGL